MCIKKNCVLTRKELDLEIKSLKTLLKTKNIYCDFHFDHYKSECLFSENECRNTLKNEFVNSPHSKCRHDLTLLECVTDGCPMSITRQLQMFDRREKHLRSLGVKCDFDKMKYKYLKEPKCSNPNMFACKNKACVHKSFRCNSVNDCGDNSDEYDCSFYTVPSFSLKGKKRQ
ncbi:low-density lipoprotein receptor-related protein 1-like [Physella acuta]|uniref:low-density lipoprotein receptor-related protein 1-like n=1 Tax=Physella acuta TaxID=109671 RepID=UPI0027DBDA3A|nr:low-density lipoprotein receptor-related protein 1-like [Physella acuta]